jgi:hypothetical protein
MVLKRKVVVLLRKLKQVMLGMSLLSEHNATRRFLISRMPPRPVRLEKPHRNWSSEVTVGAFSDAVRPRRARILVSARTRLPLRPASYVFLNNSQTGPRPQIRESQDRNSRSVLKKTPLLQHAQTKEGAVELKTPAPASTLVFRYSLLPFAPIANRGQVSKVTSSIRFLLSTLMAKGHLAILHALTPLR